MEFNHHVSKRTFIALFVFLIINLSVIYLFIFNIYKEKFIVKEKPNAAFLAKTESKACSNDCLEKIKQATESLSIMLPTSISTNQTSDLKEYYLPIGSGSEKSTTWKDVPGLSIYIDSSKYKKIQSAAFEASVTIPSGNEDVWLRLYNSTDDHPVWFSDLFFPTDTKNYLQVSQNIIPDSGNKLYKVQIKTQLGVTANVDQSRIKITAY